MAKSITFEQDTLTELNHLMYKLYKFFTLSLASVKDDIEVPFSTGDQLHLESSPHDFYVLELGSSKVSIHQFRTCYCLELCGCTTTRFKFTPLSANQTNSEYRYRNYYGYFADLDTAKNAFYLVCDDILKSNLGALF